MKSTLVIYLVLFFLTNLWAQDKGCFELQTKEKFLMFDREITNRIRTFNSLSECQGALNKIKLGKNGTTKEVVLLKGCTLCEKESNTIPDVSNKQNSGQIKSVSNGADENAYKGMCANQKQNAQLLNAKFENWKSSPSKDNRVGNFYKNALKSVRSLDCHVVLKDVNCVDGNCTIEWDIKDENQEAARKNIARKSIEGYYVKLKQKQDELLTNEVLVSLGIELVNALMSSGENVTNSKVVKNTISMSDDDFSAFDNDGNGKYETIIETKADGSGIQIMYIDTDDNGFADTKVIIGKDGIPVYEPSKIPIEDQPMLIIPKVNKVILDINNLTWEEWHKNQNIKPGEDGFITKITSNATNADDNTRKIYFDNGIMNEYTDAINHATRISDELGESVYQVYSKSSLQDDNGVTLSGIKDVTTALKMARNNEPTQSSLSLAASLIIDLEAGTQVLVFAHSRGALDTYNAVNIVSGNLTSLGKADYLKNLTVVTLGGYAPAPKQWNSFITLERHDNPGDPVPPYNSNINSIGTMPSFQEHLMENYYQYIKQYKR